MGAERPLSPFEEPGNNSTRATTPASSTHDAEPDSEDDEADQHLREEELRDRVADFVLEAMRPVTEDIVDFGLARPDTHKHRLARPNTNPYDHLRPTSRTQDDAKIASTQTNALATPQAPIPLASTLSTPVTNVSHHDTRAGTHDTPSASSQPNADISLRAIIPSASSPLSHSGAIAPYPSRLDYD
ncbi:hypothetical protein FOMPIDRAFT_1055709 [Fomitopsis schrenkii]|uniref:Uncharacterized protein n=1 Tax=Fomitopsis schrenkii TaxID=2126942 RepID=S8DRB9_FOMSC|nr:hypothetical protein FOMPIDRAFT_1055709 [Fomitopsis schrenkii]